MKEETKVLELVAETEILGHRIKMYGSVEFPWFLGKDVADWIDYSKRNNGTRQVGIMLKTVDDDEKDVKSFNTLGGIQLAVNNIQEAKSLHTVSSCQELLADFPHCICDVK